MIGRCVANRPYMYLPLKGDTNDYSVNAQNPTNTGVTTTTGQFGETNGAYEWADNTDKLEWSSSIGNTIATNLNSNATIILNSTISRFVGTTGTSQLMLGQYIGAGNSNSSFYCGYNRDESLVSTKRSATAASTIVALTPVLTTSTWYNMAFTYSSNNLKMFLDGSEIDDDNFTEIANVSSTEVFKIGNHFAGTNNWLGKMHDFRIYSQTLSNGGLKIINNEKGRISLPKKLLLDNYSGAAVAYSLRKLRYNYSGSAIRVRRSSDNTEQDIGFVNNQLNISALTTFCSGTNGFVVTWYDQSGNANNATQSTAANQPKIYDSSTGVLLVNGKPALFFDGSDDGLTHSSISGTKFTGFSVSKFESQLELYQTIYSSRISSGGSYTNYGATLLAYSNNTNMYFNTRDGASTGAALIYTTSTNQILVTGYNNGAGSGTSTVKVFENGTEKGSSTSANPISFSVSNNYDIGQERGTAAATLHGYIQEIIMYTTDESTNRTNIEGNINTYYGVY